MKVVELVINFTIWENNMACMEHWCDYCHFTTFNNEVNSPKYCPDCGKKLNHYSDEAEPVREVEEEDQWHIVQ